MRRAVEIDERRIDRIHARSGHEAKVKTHVNPAAALQLAEMRARAGSAPPGAGLPGARLAASPVGTDGGSRRLSRGADSLRKRCRESARNGSAPGNCTGCGFLCAPLTRYS